jgi:2-polyprenyl-3-methyl-5-hydroxy-6-metoxy-1,4-benzoquinol methylase
VAVAKHRLQPRTWSGAQDRRFPVLASELRHRSVLDLGAATGWWRPDWMHRAIASVASDCIGVDLDAEAVEQANERLASPILVGDAEVIRLGRTFDVVFAGELIEHLTCPAALAATAHAHLEPGGRFILTTPNAFAMSNFVYRYGRRIRTHHEHTLWFCEDTLRHFLERSGFEVERIAFLRHETPGVLRREAARLVRAPLPDRLAWNTLLAIARRGQ